MSKKEFLILVLFFCSSCMNKKCNEGTAYNRLKEVFAKERKLIEKPDEKIFKENLLNKICLLINDKKKILFIEEIYQFDNNRKGLVYIFDNGKLYYFSGGVKNGIKTGDGHNNFFALNKGLEKVKNDFSEAEKIENLFNSMKLNDSPLIQLILIDNNKGNSFYEFQYSSNYILENKQLLCYYNLKSYVVQI